MGSGRDLPVQWKALHTCFRHPLFTRYNHRPTFGVYHVLNSRKEGCTT